MSGFFFFLKFLTNFSKSTKTYMHHADTLLQVYWPLFLIYICNYLPHLKIFKWFIENSLTNHFHTSFMLVSTNKHDLCKCFECAYMYISASKWLEMKNESRGEETWTPNHHLNNSYLNKVKAPFIYL